MNNQRSGCLTAALIVSVLLLVGSIVLNLILMVGSTPSMGGSLVSAQGPKFEEGTIVPSKERDGDKIAVIYLRGLISGMEPGSIGETSAIPRELQAKDR